MGLAFPFLVLFSVEICCLYGKMGLFLHLLCKSGLCIFYPRRSCLKSWNSYLVQHVCSEWRLSETVTQTESLTGLECWWLHPWNPPVLNACWLWWDFGGTASKIPSFLWPLTSGDYVLRNVRWTLMMLAENRASS